MTNHNYKSKDFTHHDDADCCPCPCKDIERLHTHEEFTEAVKQAYIQGGIDALTRGDDK